MVGDVSSGERRVTAADIGRAAGVSRATVGFVLNDTPGQTISSGTRARVVEAAERLGYRPNNAARVLASGRSRIVLLVLPDLPQELSMRRCLDMASLVLDEAGYTLVTHTRHSTGRSRPLWESLTPDVAVALHPFSDEDVHSLHAHGVTRIFPEPGDAEPFDDATGFGQGPHLQIEHLSELGHERLAFATTTDPRLAPMADARVRVAQRRVASLGLPPLTVGAVDPTAALPVETVQQWHHAGITAVAAFNDDVAAAVASAAIRAGLGVPEDLAVIGHDDNPISSLFVPSLSTVWTDTAAIGHHLAEVALQLAREERPRRATPPMNANVIARESTTLTSRP